VKTMIEYSAEGFEETVNCPMMRVSNPVRQLTDSAGLRRHLSLAQRLFLSPLYEVEEIKYVLFKRI
jgi:hypothetical protein